MRSFRNLFIPISVSLFFFSILAYSLFTKFDPIQQIFLEVLPDSGDSPEATGVSDVSQMFNERGYYKSNSYSFDESELISDFNGNLIYEIRLYNFKGAGGLDVDMKLVYNGNVNHEVILSDSLKYSYNSNNSTLPNRYNFNIPEWMITVNGFAVQVFNFETRLLSRPTANGIGGDDLKKLIPGYHYSDHPRELASSDHDKITILTGDGSTITLVNETQNSLTGDYFVDNKGDYTKAIVTFDSSDPETNTYYKRRFVELYLGDGLIYKFVTHNMSFWDLRNTTVPGVRKPQALLLSQIRDRFGHTIGITYTSNYSGYGRPLLSGAGGVAFTYYSNGVELEDYNGEIGNYKFHFSDVAAYSEEIEGKKIPKLTIITNPLHQDSQHPIREL